MIALLLALTPASAAVGPAISNGDFALGSGTTATDWTKSSSTYGRTTLAGGGPAGAADYYLLVDANGCPGTGVAPSVSQTVTGLTPGESYSVQFSFKRYAAYGAGTPGTFAAFVDSTLAWTNSLVSSTWSSDLFVFTATSATHVIKFASERRYATDNACEDTSYGLDDVSLEAAGPSLPTPELPTLALASLGLVAVAAVAVVRRR